MDTSLDRLHSTTTERVAPSPTGRAAAAAAVAAAVIGIPSDLFHLTIDSRAEVVETVAFKAHGIGLVLALALVVPVLAALLGRLRREDGSLGPVVGLLGSAAYLGTLLVLGNVATEAFMMRLAPEQLADPTGYSLVVIIISFGLMAAGWFGIALAAGRAGILSSPLVLLLCLAALYAFTPFAGSYILFLLAIGLCAPALRRA